jgi:tetratricopeptide (TPR) repeat protein
VKEQAIQKKNGDTLSDAQIIRRQIFVILGVAGVLGGLYGMWMWGEDSGWGNPERAVKMKMEKANQAFINRDLDKAVKIYENVVEKYPKNSQVSQALTQLGAAYEEKGDIPKAVQSYNRLLQGLEGQPKKDLRAYTLLQVGKLNRQQGDLQGALKIFAQVRTDHPGTDWAGEALSETGKAWQEQRDYAKATATYKQLIKEMPAGFLAAEAQSSIGACLEAQGKDKDAIRAYQVVLDKYPSAVWDQAKARIDYLKQKHLEKKS